MEKQNWLKKAERFKKESVWKIVGSYIWGKTKLITLNIKLPDHFWMKKYKMAFSFPKKGKKYGLLN